MDHLDGLLVGIGEREKAPRDGEQAVILRRRDAMAGQIEKAHFARRPAQLAEQTRPLAGAGVKPGEIDDGQNGALGRRLDCAWRLPAVTHARLARVRASRAAIKAAS